MSRKATPWGLARSITVLLIMFTLTSSSAFSERQLLEAVLLSWGELQRQAGYFTDSGRWKGGLPKRARKEADLFGVCHEEGVNGTLCQSWTSEEERDDTAGRGECECRKNTGAYCKEWTCLKEQTERSCKRRHGKRCTATPKRRLIEKCVCLEAANTGEYCERWMCSEESRGSRLQSGVLFCRGADASGEFCRVWSGEFESNREVESLACECSSSGDRYCSHWECHARTLLRCSKHGAGWCRLGISLGVFGSLGLLFLAGGMAIIFDDVFKGKAEAWTRGKILAVYSCFMVLPWGIGVAITGGIDGMEWVVLMWCIPFVALGLALFLSKRKSVGEPPSVLTPLHEPPMIPAYSYDGKAYT